MGNCHKCGKEQDLKRGSSYRTSPRGTYPQYLQEFICEDCGRYVARGNTNDGYVYVRDGRIDDNGDDSHITGGYWL